jgi:hypothetical protein
MAGGIFVDQPFHLNPKCLFFSIIIMSLYWFSPVKKNFLLLPIIFILSYIGMAWYDHMYNCDIMYSGTGLGLNTLDSIFKPQHRNNNDEKKDLVENQEQEYLRHVYLFHIVAIVPILLYVGYYGKQSNKKIFPVVLSIGIIAFIYHGFRLMVPREIQ